LIVAVVLLQPTDATIAAQRNAAQILEMEWVLCLMITMGVGGY